MFTIFRNVFQSVAQDVNIGAKLGARCLGLCGLRLVFAFGAGCRVVVLLSREDGAEKWEEEGVLVRMVVVVEGMRRW
jgi:hypothetical protein